MIKKVFQIQRQIKENSQKLSKPIKCRQLLEYYKFNIKVFTLKVYPTMSNQLMAMIKPQEALTQLLVTFAQQNTAICQKCNNVYLKQNKLPCQCKKDFYCSKICMQKYKPEHLKSCDANHLNLNGNVNNSSILPIDMKITQYSLKGKVGLQNLGNTCYLNSVLQCLSHTQPLTEYFLKGHYYVEINMENQLGNHVNLVNAYAKLIQNLWCKSNRIYKPIKLKQQLGMVNLAFSGKNQQDAQELFNWLTDTIHENVNRVRKKEKMKTIFQNSNKSDEWLASTSWLNYISKNQSIITDTMTGMFKSQTLCLNCKKGVKSFEFFNLLILPIPDQRDISDVVLHIMHSNFNKPISKILMSIDKISFDCILEEASRAAKMPISKFKLFFMNNKYEVANICYLNKQNIKQRLLTDKLFLIQLTPQQQQILNKFSLICSVCQYKDQKKYHFLWYKRPFFIDLKVETGLSLLKKILKFLYNDAYAGRQHKTLLGTQGKSYHKFQSFMLAEKSTQKFLQILICKVNRRVYDSGYFSILYDAQHVVPNQMLIKEAIEKILPHHFNQQNEHIEERIEIVVALTQKAKKYFQFNRFQWDDKDYKQIHKDQNKKISLQKCFQTFRRSQQLQKGNLWFCGQCQLKMPAQKKMSIYKTPDILVIALNRFKSNSFSGQNIKNQKLIQFPFQLNLQKYVHNPKPMSQYIELAQNRLIYVKPACKVQCNVIPNQHFEIYAVINHFGTLKSGHYTAFIEKNKIWYEFNDQKIQLTSKGKIVTENAYMLFYKRRELL